VYEDRESLKKLLDKDTTLPVVPAHVPTELPDELQALVDRIYRGAAGGPPSLDVLRVVHYYAIRLPMSSNSDAGVAAKCVRRAHESPALTCAAQTVLPVLAVKDGNGCT